MSRLRFNKVATPATPATNKAEVFYDTSDGLIKWIDQTGTVRILGSDLTRLRLPKVATPGTPAANNMEFYVDTADYLPKVIDSTGAVKVLVRSAGTFFIPNEQCFLNGCVAGQLGATAAGPNANVVRTAILADALTTGVYTDFSIPLDAVTGTITIRPSWIPGATDGVAHTVRWQMQIRIISGVDVTAAGTAVAWTGVSATRTVNVEVLETGQASTAVTPAAGDRVRLELQRVGADAADTYVGAVHLRGIRVDYTSA